MSGFQVLQFMHHEVEILITDHGLIEHIISIIMLVQLFAQLDDSIFFGHISLPNISLFQFSHVHNFPTLMGMF